MIEQLNLFDQSIFFAINHGLANPFFDWLMPLLRNRYFWTPLYLFIIIFFIRNYGRQGWLLIIFMLLTFALSDYISSSVIKPAFQRIRPCNDPGLKDSVNSLIACGSGFSFPSSHAANHFGLAVFLITLFSHKWKYITSLAILWAFSVSFAQVYVGVHYPGDIMFGAMLGSMIGYITGTILLNLSAFYQWKPGN